MKSFLLLAGLTLSVKGYDAGFGKKALFFSKASYCDKGDIEAWKCAPCDHSTISGAS